ncbi:MAG: hypothetical protein J6K28_00450 [Alistipes sp.]|nr:hypothetical protein [Alistipes sp.]
MNNFFIRQILRNIFIQINARSKNSRLSQTFPVGNEWKSGAKIVIITIPQNANGIFFAMRANSLPIGRYPQPQGAPIRPFP